MGKKSRDEATVDGEPSPKRLKSNDSLERDRPKSKKELRAEKKAARKAAMQSSSASNNEAPLSREQYKLQKQRLRKEQRKEIFKKQIKERRIEKKIRQQKKINREINAKKRLSPKGETEHKDLSTTKTTKSKNKRNKNDSPKEQELNLKVLSEVIHGTKDESGMTKLKMGVQYKDIILGTGAMVRNKGLVTVAYKLTGGKFGAVLDSSKNFKFRIGKGEVIQGWEIGLDGMCEGGRRKLIVPPKAGYGSQDIGAGPGGILHFDITLLSVC